MREADRNRAVKVLKALLHAADDMEQATAAAKALAEVDNHFLKRALETAIAVCYGRAFTKSTLHGLDRLDYEPPDPTLAELHRSLIRHRDKVYAHTDKSNGSDVELLVEPPVRLPGTVEFLRHDEWIPIPRAQIPDLLRLFDHQRERLHAEAGLIFLGLNEKSLRPPDTPRGADGP